ncbi:MAG: TIGR00282 family metallophosphoesterase [Candidatus Sumerlaeota bacterium]|nr:TIGR00282 family metallophosphoesterase [Candidatus Sumerlaeota bacterium]
MKTRILFIGDIMGRPGRELCAQHLPTLRSRYDAIVANCENAAGGQGVTGEIAHALLDLGIDALTSGNHIWANRDVFAIIGKEDRLLRPLNYPSDPSIPGRGAGVYRVRGGLRLGVVNLMGRVFMKPIECPFRVGLAAVEELRQETPLVLVDMHAEATSEKQAMGWHLDGLATAVVGTHTHVQTSDETILPGGPAYITDVGMTGPHESVIGIKSEIILHGFLSAMPVKHEVAKGDARLEAVAIEADSETGRALKIERVRLRKGVMEELQ